MKVYIKYLAILFISITWMSSCAENEKFPRKGEELLYPIEFGTYLSRSTTSKAGDTFKDSGDTFESGDAFVVYSYYHDGGSFDNSSSTPNFMLHQAVNYDGSSWTYSPIKYWPNETGGDVSDDTDRLSFFAYYPPIAASSDTTGLVIRTTGTTDAYGETSVGLPDFYFEQKTAVTSQVDVLFSDFVSGTTRDLTKPAIDVPVTFTFMHALAQVAFEVELSTGMSMVINTMTLTGPYGCGTCTLDPSATTGLTLSWATSGDRMTYTLSNADGSDAKLLMIPQDVTSDIVLSINYDLTFEAADGSGDNIVYSGNSCSVSLNKMLDSSGNTVDSSVTTWMAGKKYTYRISPGLEKIEFCEITEDVWTVELNS